MMAGLDYVVLRNSSSTFARVNSLHVLLYLFLNFEYFFCFEVVSLSSRLLNSAFDLWIVWNDVEILRSTTLHRRKIW
jgi:hypothetical protein